MIVNPLTLYVLLTSFYCVGRIAWCVFVMANAADYRTGTVFALAMYCTWLIVAVSTLVATH